ncbi:hypothetical protein BJV77DRAFT_1015289, partial [Russula vinacea]
HSNCIRSFQHTSQKLTHIRSLRLRTRSPQCLNTVLAGLCWDNFSIALNGETFRHTYYVDLELSATACHEKAY